MREEPCVCDVYTQPLRLFKHGSSERHRFPRLKTKGRYMCWCTTFSIRYRARGAIPASGSCAHPAAKRHCVTGVRAVPALPGHGIRRTLYSKSLSARKCPHLRRAPKHLPNRPVLAERPDRKPYGRAAAPLQGRERHGRQMKCTQISEDRRAARAAPYTAAPYSGSAV